MNLDDALRLIFLPTQAQKLAFLQARNPFLVEEDLKALNKCLQEYLEWSISDKILEQVKNKVKSILEFQVQTGNDWQENSSVQEAWQELGELLNPFDQYSDDPQVHMETLLFEYLCGFRIREEQAQIMHGLVEKIFNEDRNGQPTAAVFQMIMGGGKTSVILAQMAKLAAKNGRVPIFIAHHSQYPSLKANLVNNQYNRLNQDVIDLDFKREDLASVKILQFINSQLHAAKENGRLLLMKTSFLLMLRLEFIDQIKALSDPENLDPLNFERIKELAKILSFIKDKDKALLLGDEVDWILNILEEVNFPAGLSVVISKNSLDLIKQVYTVLATHPEISSTLKLIQDDQSLVAKQKLADEVFPKLADILMDEYPPLSNLIPPRNFRFFRESLKDYILEKIDARLSDGILSANEDQFLDELNILEGEERQKARRHLEFLSHLHALKNQPSEASHKSLSAVALLKELCAEILPITLGKSYNRSYGFLEEGKIIPYLGVDAPNHTEFGNIYVTACCYFQAALQQGVDLDRLKKYREKLREASSYYAELYHCSPEETAEAQHFKAMTDLDLHQEWSEENLNEAILKINQDPQRCLDFYAEFSSLYLRYHTSLLNCGPIALAHMSGQFIGCSATLWNKDTFEKKIAESCMVQEGTEGKILVKLADDIEKGKSFLSVVDQADPHHILNAVLEKRGQEAAQNLRAIIDESGMLKRFSNRAVAEEILKFGPLVNEIDAVVFLNKSGGKEAFSLLKRGEKNPVPLLTTSRKEMEKQGVHPDRVFVYFDELRSTGSDIPFKANGIAARTYDPFATTMRTDLQAALRARNFFHAQTEDTIIQRETLEGFVNYDAAAPEGCLNAKNFFLTSVRNQAKLKQTQLLRSVLEQVRESYCALIFQKLVHHFSQAGRDVDPEEIELFLAAEWLFYSQFKDDPIALFLDLQKEVPAYEVVDGYLKEMDRRFQDSCAYYFDAAELEPLVEAAKQISDWSHENLIWNVPSSALSAHLEKEITVQKQHENQLEVNVEVQKQTQKELQKYAVRVDAPAAKFIPWERPVTDPQSFSDYKHPDLITFRKLLKRRPYDHPYHKIFPKDLYISENLTRSLEIDLHVFHKAQKNGYHILLVKDQGTFRALFIDLQEAAFWRKEIKQWALNDCWLCDLDGHVLNENKHLPKESLEILQRAQWWGHFYNGNASYLRAHPNLIKQEMKNENFELKHQFLVLKTAHDPLQSRILAIDPHLAEKPLEAPVFHFNDKDEEEEWKAQEIAGLSDEELNKKQFHFARYFLAEQVPKLKRSGYFSYLPVEQFEHVTPEQVALIPSHRLQHLCRSEQVARVSPEKIGYLRGEALEYIPEQYLDRIHPEALPHLLPEMQQKYQQLQIGKMGLEAFARSVEPGAASVLLPECIPFISDRCLPYLQTSEQLANVAPEKYPLLKARQYHLVPQKHWYLFDFADYEKYRQEQEIPKGAETFIQGMNADWVNEMDPRLAKFFNEEQVRKIASPQAISYLNDRQLRWLDASLAAYLDVYQIAGLSAQHQHLIATFEDPKIINQLSNEALQELSVEQIQKIDDRETLLRLKQEFYAHFLKDQIVLLQPDQAVDQEVLRCLDPEQLIGVERSKIISYLSYLKDSTLKSLEASIFTELEDLPLKIRRKLTASQIQCFLNGLNNRKIPAAKYLKETAAFQWRGMDRIFIESFFKDQPAIAVHHIPKMHVPFLAKDALLKWHHANKRQDILRGLCALIFYPFVLFSALMLFLFVQPKKTSMQKVFRRLALSPLRLIARESYYRLISAG